MRKIVKIGIAALAAIVVLGLAVGCGNDDTKKPTDTPDATLTSVKFNNEAATLGTPNAKFSGAVAGSVVVLQASNNITATPKDSKAEVMMAVAKKGVLDEDDLWSDTLLEFETGDQLAIKVTASDKKTVLYYKIGVTLADVALSSLDVGGIDVTLPNAGASWETAAEGTALFSYPADQQPAGGIVISAVATDAAATVAYAKVTGAGAPTFGTETSFTFADGDFLYIKVTKGNETAYYKIKINFMQSGTIKYGSPKIGYGTDPANLDMGVDGVLAGGVGYIDPLWDDPTLEVYEIKKPYPGDSGSYLADPSAFPPFEAKAKAFWDEEGLSVYVWVKDGDLTAVDAEHESDSFELFVNEDLSFTGTGGQKYSNGGSQYRVASAGRRSGEGNSPAAMSALNKTTGWHTSDGYIVIMKAPWRLRNQFFSSTTYRNGWEFGFELQINACTVAGTRYATFVWNNVDHTNYQNASDYGIAKLVDGPANPVYPALPARISPQPSGGSFKEGDPVTLTVGATTIDGGQITYQWYSATGNGLEGTAISGQTGTTYSFSAPAETTFYYAEVTNTLGASVNTIKSAYARVNITVAALPDLFIDKVTMVNTSVPVYGFKLPDGKTFGDYTKIKLKMKMETASVTGRLRVWGNYDYATWTDANDRPAMQNASPGGLLISSSDGGTTFTDQWTDYERTFNARDAADTAAAIKASTGVILLAIGPVPPAGGSDTKTYYVKNITLENDDGSLVVKALNPEDNLLWGGNGKGAYVTQNPADVVTRSWEADPDWVAPPAGGVLANIVGSAGSAETGTIAIDTDGVTVMVRNEKTRTNLGVWYELPADWNEYETLKITFDTNIIDGVAKITAKQGKSFATDLVGANKQYIDLTTGEKVLEFAISEFALSGMDNAVAFQINSWGDSGLDLKMYFDFTCTSIELVNHIGPPAVAETETVVINLDVTGIYSGIAGITPRVANTPADGKAMFVFTSAAANTYADIPLTTEQIAQVNVATSIKIDVQGSSTDDTNSFRYYLGKANAGSSWNKTNALPNNDSTGNSFATNITGEKEGVLTANTLDASGCFILRSDTANATTTVTITSVTITLEVPK